MSLDPPMVLLPGLVALLAGFIDAVAGGGGMLVMPALLSTGMPPHLVLGTNKLVGTFGTCNASLAFIRKDLFKPAWWRAAAPGTLMLGAFIGANSAIRCGGPFIRIMLIGVVLLMVGRLVVLELC